MFSGLRTSVFLAVNTLLMAAPPTTSLLRKDISTAIVLANGTENRNLASLAGGKPHALLLISPSLPLELCTAVSNEMKRVKGFGLEVTLIWTTPGKNYSIAVINAQCLERVKLSLHRQ